MKFTPNSSYGWGEQRINIDGGKWPLLRFGKGFGFLPKEHAPQSMPVDQCLRFVESSAKSCAAQTTAAEGVNEKNYDALAVAISSQANAFSWGALLLGFIGVLGAIGWGVVVRSWAAIEARKEAKKCADEMISKWLSEEAPEIISKHIQYINDASLGSNDDVKAADDIGKGAG